MILPLIPSLPLLSFEKWRIDYVWPIYLRSSRGMAYIILAMDYMTKWVEVEIVKVADKKTTALFIFENIIPNIKFQRS